MKNLDLLYCIERDFSKKGKTGYLGFEELHVDFCNLTYEKIGGIIMLTKESLSMEKRVVDLSRDTVKEYIKEVCDAKLINIEEINEDLLKDIKKYKLLIA